MNVLTIVGVLISLAAAAFTFYQARIARAAVKQANLMRLFSTFDVASQISIERPELLYSVHGLGKEISESEAIAIAYLSSLIDGFQHYYDAEYNGDFSRMEMALKVKSNFLNRVLAFPVNQERWERMKAIYYGSFDDEFIRAIDNLISLENKKNTQ